MGRNRTEREVGGEITSLGDRTVLVREASAVHVGGSEREGEIGSGVIVRFVCPCAGEGEVLVAFAADALGEGDVRMAGLVVVVVVMFVLVFVVVRVRRGMGLIGDGDCGRFALRHTRG